MQRHCGCFTQANERSAAFDQLIHLALLRRRRDPGVQLGVLVGDHAGYELGIYTIGLATQPNGLGIVPGILGIEQEDQKAELVGSLCEQLMIATRGFHADAAAHRQTLEKGKHRGVLISDLTYGKAAFRTGHHDLVLGDIDTDIEHYRWGLHEVFPMIKLRRCWGGTHRRKLAFKSAVVAARFLIDAWRCGWGESFGVCLSAESRCGPWPLHPGIFTVSEERRKHHTSRPSRTSLTSQKGTSPVDYQPSLTSFYRHG